MWITEKVNLAKAQFMDGINIDIEQAVMEGSPEYYALTDLVKETTEAFHREIPGSQVKNMFWYGSVGFIHFFPREILWPLHYLQMNLAKKWVNETL